MVAVIGLGGRGLPRGAQLVRMPTLSGDSFGELLNEYAKLLCRGWGADIITLQLAPPFAEHLGLASKPARGVSFFRDSTNAITRPAPPFTERLGLTPRLS